MNGRRWVGAAAADAELRGVAREKTLAAGSGKRTRLGDLAAPSARPGGRSATALADGVADVADAVPDLAHGVGDPFRPK